MPVSSSTEHWIKPDALTINLNHFGDPDYLQVSVLAGAVVMAFKQDVIGYNAAHNYRTWPIEAANSYLETTSAVNVYAKLTRSEVNARALIAYDPVLRDIEGREITYTEDGSEILGEPNPDLYYVFLGQISASVNSNGESVLREWTIDFKTGNLDTNQYQNEEAGGEWTKMFRLNKMTDMIDVLKTISSAIFQKIFIKNKEISNVKRSIDNDEDVPINDQTIPTTKYIQTVSDNKYLRKDQDDRTPYKLNVGDKFTAEKGIQIGESFIPGILTGSGGYFDEYANGEVESLIIRRFLEVPELRYNRVQVTLGDKWNAAGAGVIERVSSDSDTTGTAWLKLEEGEFGAIAVGDICMGIFHSMTASENATEDADDSRGNFQFAGFYTCYFTITEITGKDNKQFRYQMRPVSDRWKLTYHPSEAMTFVCYGSFTRTDRQTSVYTTRTYTRLLKSQNTWEISASNIAMQYGNMENMSIHGLDMAGYSVYLNNIYMTGTLKQVKPDGTPVNVANDRGYWVSGTTYAYYDRVSHNGSLWLCVNENGTSSEPKKSDSSWLCQVESGSSIQAAGRWETKNTPYPANSIVTFADKVWISNKETSNPPFGTYTDKDGNRLTYNDGGYILVETLIQSEDWDLLLDAPQLTDGKDGESLQVRYSSDKSNWHVTFVEGDVWMQQRVGEGSVWSDAIRIVGESGSAGTDGTYYDYQFAVNDSLDVEPTTGWQDIPPSVGIGQYLWMRTRLVNPNTSEENPWSVVRIGGEKGEQGDSVSNMGAWKTGMAVPYLGMVTMGGKTFISKVATNNPPMWTWTDKDGNRLIYKDGGYILTGELNTDEYDLVMQDGKDGKDGRDGKGYEYIYIHTKEDNRPSTPTSEQVDDYIPSGWHDDPIGVTSSLPYEWVSLRTKRDGVWSAYSTPSLWAKYSIDAILADLDNEMDNVALGSDGKTISDTTISITAAMYYGSTKQALESIEVGSVQGITSSYVLNTGVVTLKVSKGVVLGERTEIPITVTASINGKTESRTLKFTLAAVKGGADAVLYDIVTSVSAIGKRKDGSYTVAGVSATRMKTIGEKSSETTDGVLMYSIDGGTEQAINNNVLIAAERIGSKVQFIFYNSEGVVVDKESVPMVIDGSDGKDGEGFTLLGNWKTGLVVPKMGVVTMGGESFAAKVATNNPPMWTWTDKDGNRFIFPDGDYILTGELNTSEYDRWTVKGENGKDGKDGRDGKDYEYIYIHSKTEDKPSKPISEQKDDYIPTGWHDDPIGVTESLPYEWVCVRIKKDGIWSDYSTPALWAKFGKDGINGLQGIQGEKGEQGIQGEKGADGKTSYFHIKYADDANGKNMNESGGDYIGTYVDFVQSDSTDPKKYTWVKTKGAQGDKGDQGIAGTNGENGQTSYLHIAYANSADGKTDFSVSDSTGKLYIGQYTDFVLNDSTEPTKYKWTLIKGADGKDGVGINSITTTYGKSTSASIMPSSWSGTMPSVGEGEYLWTRMVTDYTDPNKEDTVSYTYTYQGKSGQAGTSVSVKSIQYQAGTSPTTAPTGSWSNNMVSVPQGQYLWSKTTFSDGSVAYGVAKQGEDGKDGEGFTMMGNWKTGMTVPKMGVVTMGGECFAAKVATTNPPLWCWTDKEGNRLIFSASEYILTGELNTSEYDRWTVKGENGKDGQDGKDGKDGKDGESSFKSTVFIRQELTPATPTGGSYDSPIPTSSPKWEDGIPSGELTLWASTCTFKKGDESEPKWSEPSKMTDTASFEVVYHSSETTPSAPTNYPNTTGSWTPDNGWTDDPTTSSVWMATAVKSNGLWGEWKLSKIKGEKGDKGDKGDTGEQGIQGCIIRDSEWVLGTQYRNDEALTSGTRYIDVVLVRNDSSATGWDAYKCKITHTSTAATSPSNADYWEQFGANITTIFTSLIIAKNAKINFLQGNQLLIQKNDGKVTAGLSGGDEGDKIRFWAGSDIPDSAPFRVDETGNIIAEKGTFGGYLRTTLMDVVNSDATPVSSKYNVDFNAYRLNKNVYVDATFCEVVLPCSDDYSGVRVIIMDTYYAKSRTARNPTLIRTEDGSSIACGLLNTESTTRKYLVHAIRIDCGIVELIYKSYENVYGYKEKAWIVISQSCGTFEEYNE